MFDKLKETLFKYETFSENEWKLIRNNFRVKTLEKSEFFLQQGQVCRTIGFVNFGLLRTFIIDEKGNETTTHFSYEYSFVVSFYSFKNQEASFENIQVVAPVQILVMEFRNLHKLFVEVPKWESLYRKIIEDAYACMEQKNYFLQSFSAQKKYNELIENSHTEIIQNAQLGHIASYLGIKQETLSRIRKKLAGKDS